MTSGNTTQHSTASDDPRADSSWRRVRVATVGGVCAGAARAVMSWLLAHLTHHD